MFLVIDWFMIVHHDSLIVKSPFCVCACVCVCVTDICITMQSVNHVDTLECLNMVVDRYP